jgi:hypothetical protein
MVSVMTMATTLTAGTRIHYTGDMANDPGDGSVTAVTDGRHGVFYDITLDDGRIFRMTPHVSCVFNGPGRRFWIMSEYQAKRAAEIAKYTAAAASYRQARAG